MKIVMIGVGSICFGAKSIYDLTTFKETLTIDSMELLGQLLFSQREQEPLTDALFRDELIDKPRLRQIFHAVFPIPFPWTGNLNFI